MKDRSNQQVFNRLKSIRKRRILTKIKSFLGKRLILTQKFFLSSIFPVFFCYRVPPKKEKGENFDKRNKLLDILWEVLYNSALWLKELINLPKENVAPSTAFLPEKKPKAATRFFGAGGKRAGKN